MLNDILGLPESMEGIGKIYPVSILEYSRFKELANKYLMLEVNNLKYEYNIETSESNFEIIFSELMAFELAKNDLLVSLVSDEKMKENLQKLKSSTQKWEVDEFLELFKIILKKDVYINEDKKCIYIGSPLDKNNINSENFDKFREIVFRQNLLFLQLYYEDEILQSMLMDLRQQRSENPNPEKEDLNAIIQVICLKSNMGLSEIKELTYYQLMSLYSRMNLIENYEWIKLVQTSGYGSKDIQVPRIDKTIDLNRHPESFDFVEAISGVDEKI